jgi:hypothetical protein
VAGASAPSLKQLVKRKRFCPRSSSRDTCKAYLDLDVLQRFSVILTADPGDFSGTPEAHYIIANLQDKHAKPLDASICRGQFLGTLMGQRVLVVTTGQVKVDACKHDPGHNMTLAYGAYTDAVTSSSDAVPASCRHWAACSRALHLGNSQCLWTVGQGDHLLWDQRLVSSAWRHSQPTQLQQGQ